MATVTAFPLNTVVLSPLIGTKLTFSTETADEDPGSGIFRFNHATVASATAAYLSDDDINARDVSALWDRIDNSDNTVKATIRFENPNDQSIWAEFEVTGSVVDGTGYRKITLQNGVSAGTFASGATFNILPTRAGNVGSIDYGETVNVIGSIGGGTQDIDLTLGNVVSATVDTSETTFTFSNPSASGAACSFTLFLTNGGSQTVNWPASVDWAGGTAPSLTAAGVDILTFATVDGGTIWYGFAAGLDMS